MLKLTMIGRLGNDAEVRDAAGKKVISFNLAHSESYTDKTGTKQDRTTWVRCSLWREEGRTRVADYLRKGGQVYVEGTPSVRTYENKDGQHVASLELTVLSLELLGGKNENEGGGGGGNFSNASSGPQNAFGAYEQPKPKTQAPTKPYEDPNEAVDDDLPF